MRKKQCNIEAIPTNRILLVKELPMCGFKAENAYMTTIVKAIVKFLFLFQLVFFNGCATSIPFLDAKIQKKGSKSVSFSYQPTVVEDQFVGRQKLWDDTLSDTHHPTTLFFPGPFGTPWVGQYSQVISNRIEIGFGTLGVYERIAIVNPQNYDEFSIADVAISQICNASAAFLLEHYVEANVNCGILFGMPLRSSVSLTTGIIGKYSNIDAGHFWKNGDSGDVWQVSLVATRKQIILPLNLIFSSHKSGSNVSGAVGISFPFDIKEKYTYVESILHAGDRETNMSYINKLNIALNVSLKIQFKE